MSRTAIISIKYSNDSDRRKYLMMKDGARSWTPFEEKATQFENIGKATNFIFANYTDVQIRQNDMTANILSMDYTKEIIGELREI